MGALGIFLLAAGAVLYFAVDATVSGLDIATVGVILMVVGAVAVIAGLVQSNFMGFGFRSRTERHVSSDGRDVVEDHRTY